MKKKTNKIVYVILVIAAVLSAALVPFAAVRRKGFLSEGNAEMADFSITMGTGGIVCAAVLVGIIVLLLLKDKKTGARQALFCRELGKTPLFESWFLQEEDEIKKKHRLPRLVVGILSVPMIASLPGLLVISLDGVSGPFWFGFVAFFFCLFVVCFVWWISDYWKQYMVSLLDTIAKKLPSAAEKEAFAGRMTGSGAKTFSYQAGPQHGASNAWVTGEYAYFREFRKCRIIRTEEMDKAVLKKATYTPGMRPHFRTCFVMEVSVCGGREKNWSAYFLRQEDLFYALGVLKSAGLPDERIENQLEESKTVWKRRGQ